MMLVVTFPENCHAERCWISAVLLGEFLGLSYALEFDSGPKVRLSAAGRTLALSDAFFAGLSDRWLARGAEHAGLAQRWAVAESGLDPDLCDSTVPVLFGAAGFAIADNGDGALDLDIFGSAFFMLTRYEEACTAARDEHGRFPAQFSLAKRMDFLGRPIVDEYVEILWAAMKRVWPGLERKQRSARTLVSCDVDSPFDPACASLYRLGRRVLGRSWRDKSLQALPSTLGNYWQVKRGNNTRDPYRQAIFWMMDVNEKAGNQLTFNFIPENTDRNLDNRHRLDEPRLRSLMRSIHSRGHLIGFHPGYNTFRHPAAFARSAGTLRRVMEEEKIGQDVLGGRQHYLRWDVATTAQLWDANDMCYDSTLSYPTVPGFRCGTCHEYTMYDLVNRKPLVLRQRPLIVMETAVIDQGNMGLGHSVEALELMRHYKRICARFNGDFTLLWHNSSFENTADQAMYCDLIN